jgi:protein phosphatase 2C family protein 2/3
MVEEIMEMEVIQLHLVKQLLEEEKVEQVRKKSGLMTGGDLTEAVATYKTTQANKKHYPENLDSKELNFTAAQDTMQGTREEQEDAHILKLHDNKKFAVFAVFDGHGGSQVSKWLETNFNDKLVGAKFKIDGDLNAQKKFFKQLYIDIDEELSKKQFNSGSTAIVVIVTTTKIIVVNLGDSRAIGIKTGSPKLVFETKDHDLKYQGEEARVKASGYTIKTHKGENYVSGKGCGLNLTRAFGDFDCKKFEENGKPASPEKQAVSVVPDIALYDRKDVDCIILGCDGVWNFIQNDTLAKWIQEPDNIKRSPKELASDIIDNALVLNTSDNISAIVIKLNKSEEQGQQAPPQQPPQPPPQQPPQQPPQPPPQQPPQPPPQQPPQPPPQQPPQPPPAKVGGTRRKRAKTNKKKRLIKFYY